MKEGGRQRSGRGEGGRNRGGGGREGSGRERQTDMPGARVKLSNARGSMSGTMKVLPGFSPLLERAKQMCTQFQHPRGWMENRSVRNNGH